VFTIRVPASTSNLGAGFDTFGLALALYLDVAVVACDDPDLAGTIVEVDGESGEIPTSAENLVHVAYRLAAAREQVEAPAVCFRMRNEIPVSRGLGSSAAAVVAGLTAFEVVTGRAMSTDQLIAYGVEVEGHADNVAPALLGGFVTCCTVGVETPVVARREWPAELRAVVVVPDVSIATAEARRILPETVPRRDAIFNAQRAALFVAALDEGRWASLGEAMRDRLHQPYREALLPGLAEALAMPAEGPLVGVAMSGSGSAVLALATGEHEAVGARIAECFTRNGVAASVLVLEADSHGRRVIERD
jgi:homoserine kinase